MIKESFVFNKKSSLVIYGCAGTGIVFFDNLTQKGYSVCAFFDRNASNLENKLLIDGINVPVYTVEDASFSEKEKAEIVVVISIRNAIEQTQVAKLLQQKGYCNIIYLPMLSVHKNNKESIDKMREFYRELEQDRVADQEALPCQQSLNCSVFFDQAIIEEKENNITAWVPIALIYLETAEYISQQKEKYKVASMNSISEYADKNIVTYSGIIEMFKFFQYGTGNVENYLARMEQISLPMQKKSSLDNQRFLQDRQQCFALLSQALNEDSTFFLKSASLVKWNKKGYFNILDGRHRILFFYVKGLNRVPVQMTKKDYAQWINTEQVDVCKKYLVKHQIEEVDMPIQHPFFYHIKVQRESFGKTTLATLQEFVGVRNLEQDKVLDVNAGTGYFAQHFARMGANVFAIEKNKEKFELAEILNTLYQVPKIYMDKKDIFSFSINEKFEIVLAIKLISQFGEKQEKLEALKILDFFTKDILIWESGAEIDEEKKFILENSSFVSYEKLRNTFDGKCIGELGVFKK